MGAVSPPARSGLVDAVAVATSAAVKELFRVHPKDHFYYCSLVTTGEALPPNLVAWSSEALEAVASQCPDAHDARFNLKFRALGRLDFNDARAWQAGYDFRMSVMEEAMARVDAAGLFGTGAQRASIVINVEVMPPDHTNVERALRLNPPEALTEWLKEAAERE